jgi:hypothetical protein
MINDEHWGSAWGILRQILDFTFVPTLNVVISMTIRTNNNKFTVYAENNLIVFYQINNNWYTFDKFYK